MSKNSCIVAEKHRRCVLRMARAELLLFKQIFYSKNIDMYGKVCYFTQVTAEDSRCCKSVRIETPTEEG